MLLRNFLPNEDLVTLINTESWGYFSLPLRDILFGVAVRKHNAKATPALSGTQHLGKDRC